jgi:hypothetical protein
MASETRSTTGEVAQLTAGDLVPGADSPLEPAELLIPEVRQRARRRRLRNLGAVGLVVVGVVAFVIVDASDTPARHHTAGGRTATGQATTDSAISGPVATSTQVLASGQGALRTWNSTSGTTAVQELIAPTGVVTSIERNVYSAGHDRLTDTHTAIFPVPRDWATESTSSVCQLTCYADIWEYPAPTLVRRFLADHELKIVGLSTKMDGRTVVEAVSTPALPGAVNEGPPTKTWLDPANDEVVRFSDGIPGSPVTTYTWLPGTPANLAHLGLSIPAGYTKVANYYAGSVAPLSPPMTPSYRSLLVSCVTQSSHESTPPTSMLFTSVRTGSAGGTPWTLWIGNQAGYTVFAMVSGLGTHAQCVPGAGESTNWALPNYELGVGELPGQPIAFVFGVVSDPSISRVKATVMGVNVDVALRSLPVSLLAARFAFAEVTGLGCADLDEGGLHYSDEVYEGMRSVGGTTASEKAGGTCRT